MSKYESLMKRLKEMHQLLNEMQDIVYLGQPIDAVDSLIFNKVIESYLELSQVYDELKKLVSGSLLCKKDADRLNFFLKNIHDPGQTFIEDIL